MYEKKRRERRFPPIFSNCALHTYPFDKFAPFYSENSPTNPQKPTPFRPNPSAFSSFSSIFCNFTALFLSPQGEGKNLLARALCAHSDFSFFAFTPSPNPPKSLSHNTLRVKASPQKPSPAAYRDFPLDAGAFSVPKTAPTHPHPAPEKVNIKQG